jgi:hypothetical protein
MPWHMRTVHRHGRTSANHVQCMCRHAGCLLRHFTYVSVTATATPVPLPLNQPACPPPNLSAILTTQQCARLPHVQRSGGSLLIARSSLALLPALSVALLLLSRMS